MQNQLRANKYLRRSERSRASAAERKSLDDGGLLLFGVFGFGLLEDEDGAGQNEVAFPKLLKENLACNQQN
jgi:hypothetical protein